MTVYKKLTPNLLVADVSRSVSFYVDVLGFERGMTVPDVPPFAFASVTSGTLEIFFNEARQAAEEYPSFAGKPIGASGTMFIEVDGIDALHDRLHGRVSVVMPIETKWYGMREFAIADPDGYIITFAART